MTLKYLLAVLILAFGFNQAWAAVPIPCGNSINAAIAANPAGTVFNLAPNCTYSGQQWSSKNNIQLIGAGAGSTIIDGGHANIAATVGAPPYGGDGSTGVVIDSVTIQNYGPDTANNTTSQFYTWNGWIVRNCIITGGGGTGINLVGSATLINSTVTGNREIGISGDLSLAGALSPTTITNNEISNNNTRLDNPDNSASGIKMVGQGAAIVVTNNYIHDNLGTGLWFDIGVAAATIQNNTITHNSYHGIMWEISNGPADISQNLSSGNGWDSRMPTQGDQIFVSSAANANIYNNTLQVPVAIGGWQPNGFVFIAETRANSVPENNVNFHNNSVTFLSATGYQGFANYAGVTVTGSVSNANRFYVTNSGDSHFFWNISSATPATFASYQTSSGQDANTTLAIGVPPVNTGGPFSVSQAFNINVAPGVAGACNCAAGNAPNICFNTQSVAAGGPISVSWACGSTNPNSYIVLVNINQFAQAGQGIIPSYYKIIGGAVSGTTTLTAPNAKVDRDEQWLVDLLQDYCCTGGLLATSATPVTVLKSINPPAPVASLPASLAGDPFTPQHTNTVCASGCDFVDLGGAVHNAAVNGWDFVKITISAGDYPFPQFNFPGPQDYPAHLWIYGTSPDGKTFPHLFGVTQTAGNIFFTNKYGTGAASLTLDNLEIGPWDWKAMVPIDGTTWTLRNVYGYNTLDAFESGNSVDFTVNIYNSVFARNGGGSGPDHNVYVGGGNYNNTVNIVNSVFEQANLGHSLKTRAKVNNISCSMFLVNADNVYLGSQDIDFDWGNTVINKSLLFNGMGGGAGWNNENSWDNDKFGVENEYGSTAAVPDYNQVVTNSNMVNDHNSTVWPMILGTRFTGPSPVPAPWTNNNFVWNCANCRDLSNNGTTPGGEVSTEHTGDISDVTLDATNHAYTSWSTAGFSVTPNQEPYGWRDLLPLMPAGCTDPIGLVKIPAGGGGGGPPPLSVNASSPISPVCAAAPATVISNITISGGDGNPVTLSISDPAGSFVLSSTTPPANIIVAPGGIAPAACGTIDNVTVSGTQP